MLTDLLKWNPADELRSIFDQFERRLGDWSRASSQRATAETKSEQERLMLRIPLPGMSREDVQITTAGRTLRVRASRTDGDGSLAEYEQVLTVPDNVDLERITASMRHGLLELSLPYSEAMKPRTIEIAGETPKQLSAAAA